MAYLLRRWIEEFFEWSRLAVLQVAIPCAPTNTARSITASRLYVRVLLSEFVSVLTVRLGALVGCVRSNSLSKRFCESRIQCLLAARRPTAIARLVITIVVDAVKRVLVGRTAPHVGHEVLKPNTTRLHDAPALANFNSTTTPILEIWPLRVLAPLDHVPPNPVQAFFLAVLHSRAPRLVSKSYSNTSAMGVD